MAESENKRPRRTPQERATEVDCKIEKVKAAIAELEEKKQAAIADYDAKIAAAQDRIKGLEAKKQEIWPLSLPASSAKQRNRRSRKLSSWR